MKAEEQIKEYLDKARISNLLSRYFRAIDDKQLDKSIVETTFTADAKIIKPNDAVSLGHADILDGHMKNFARFKATHHVMTDYIIDITTNMAILTANMTAMHLWADSDSMPTLNNTHFFAGGVLRGKAVNADNGWRISELSNKVVWRTGDGIYKWY